MYDNLIFCRSGEGGNEGKLTKEEKEWWGA